VFKGTVVPVTIIFYLQQDYNVICSILFKLSTLVAFTLGRAGFKPRKSCYPFLTILISKSLTWIFVQNLEQHLYQNKQASLLKFSNQPVQ
jgi:hypothetical protein